MEDDSVKISEGEQQVVDVRRRGAEAEGELGRGGAGAGLDQVGDQFVVEPGQGEFVIHCSVMLWPSVRGIVPADNAKASVSA
jgi:hypothetical protein